jgi:HSP20 family protein
MELPPGKRKMNALSRWDPFRELEDMQHRLSSVLGRQTQRSQEGGRESMTVAEWAPLVDISEDDNEYLIKADLPEVKKEELKITVENGVLVLSGERKLEKEEKGRKYHRIERAYGSFGRSFSLPDNADAEKVNAEFKDGVLKLHIAKSEAARPKQIEVKVS